MKVYADVPQKFATQLILDVLFVCWVIFWIWIGDVVHDGVLTLAEPGEQIAASATDLAESLSDAGDFLGDVPVVGGGVATPFDRASDASTSLAGAGEAEVRAVERLAFWLGFSIAVLPILYLAPRYLPQRIRWVREATAGQQYLDSEADLEIFALRAINNQPLHVLARVSDDPVGALRRGDQDTVAALAQLELRRTGLFVNHLPSGTVTR